MKRLVLILLCLAASAQTQNKSLSNSTAQWSVYPGGTPAMPDWGGTYSDIFHTTSVGAVTLTATGGSGTMLNFASVPGSIVAGMVVTDADSNTCIALPGSASTTNVLPTTVVSTTGTSVLLSQPIAGTVSGSPTFTFSSPIQVTRVPGLSTCTIASWSSLTVYTPLRPVAYGGSWWVWDYSVGTQSPTGAGNYPGNGGTNDHWINVPTLAGACSYLGAWPAYSKRQAFNSDNSLMYVDSLWGWPQLYTLSGGVLTYNQEVNNSLAPAMGSTNDSETWSHTDPTTMYLFNRGYAQFGKVVFNSGAQSSAATVLHTFSQDSAGAMAGDCPLNSLYFVANGGEGNPSADDIRWGAWCQPYYYTYSYPNRLLVYQNDDVAASPNYSVGTGAVIAKADTAVLCQNSTGSVAATVSANVTNSSTVTVTGQLTPPYGSIGQFSTLYVGGGLYGTSSFQSGTELTATPTYNSGTGLTTLTLSNNVTLPAGMAIKLITTPIDWLGMSPDGKQMIVAWATPSSGIYESTWSTCHGDELFDVNNPSEGTPGTLTSRGMVASSDVHGDVGYDVNGYPIYATMTGSSLSAAQSTFYDWAVEVTKFADVIPPTNGAAWITASSGSGTTLNYSASSGATITAGMVVADLSGSGYVNPVTTVSSAGSGTLTLSQSLNGTVASGKLFQLYPTGSAGYTNGSLPTTTYVRRYFLPCTWYSGIQTTGNTGDNYNDCTGSAYPGGTLGSTSNHVSGRGSETPQSYGWFLLSGFPTGDTAGAESPGWGRSENMALKFDTTVPSAIQLTTSGASSNTGPGGTAVIPFASTSLSFNAGGVSTPTIAVGMRVHNSTKIPDNTTVTAFTSTSVTLSAPATSTISSGTTLTFFSALPFYRISRNVGMRNGGNTTQCSQGTDYFQEPHSTVSREFSHILFASSWLKQCGQVAAFMATLPGAAAPAMTVAPMSQSVLAGNVSWTVHNPAAGYSWSISPADCVTNSGSGSGDGSLITSTCNTAGSHMLTVNDTKTILSPAFSVTAYAPLTITPGSVSLYRYQSQTFTVSGGITPYSWSAPGAIVTTGSGATFTTSWPSANSYAVTVTDATSNTTGATVNVSGQPPAAISAKAQISGRTGIQ